MNFLSKRKSKTEDTEVTSVGFHSTQKDKKEKFSFLRIFRIRRSKLDKQVDHRNYPLW
tara:strand:- start:340 stop:513 length:174 start_codon:yes stop_codon:yes gene_type:complete